MIPEKILLKRALQSTVCCAILFKSVFNGAFYNFRSEKGHHCLTSKHTVLPGRNVFILPQIDSIIIFFVV